MTCCPGTGSLSCSRLVCEDDNLTSEGHPLPVPGARLTWGQAVPPRLGAGGGGGAAQGRTEPPLHPCCIFIESDPLPLWSPSGQSLTSSSLGAENGHLPDHLLVLHSPMETWVSGLSTLVLPEPPLPSYGPRGFLGPRRPALQSPVLLHVAVFHFKRQFCCHF